MANQVLAQSPAGGPVEGEGGFFALKASDSSAAGYGVVGITAAADVLGDMRGSSPLESSRLIAGVYGISDLPAGFGGNTAGVLGENFTDGTGVCGASKTGMGVHGVNDAPQGGSIKPDFGAGVWGESTNGLGVFGSSDNNVGIQGRSLNDDGIQGFASAPGKSGVAGFHSNAGHGVFGQSGSGAGTMGVSDTGIGAYGQSNGHNGVEGRASADRRSGVAGFHSGSGPGVFGQSATGSAGYFQGDVEVTGDIRLINGNDVAETFDLKAVDGVEPGTVMVLDDLGGLVQSRQTYDNKVVGVVAGAGNYKPGIVLGAREVKNEQIPIALLGRTFCKVDAQYSSIAIGDMLTTSSTPGHAMKASDPAKAFGAVIGKALQPLTAGRGLIPILICLQ